MCRIACGPPMDGHVFGADLPGWFGIESHTQRWTNGNAELPLERGTLRAPAAILEIG